MQKCNKYREFQELSIIPIINDAIKKSNFSATHIYAQPSSLQLWGGGGGAQGRKSG